MIRVLVWNEFLHEKEYEITKQLYPDGIHNYIADFLKCDDIEVKTATSFDENFGITKELLDETDVIIWWGHARHKIIPDEVAALVRDAVLEGMGAVFLHSSHHSKPFKLLIGTSGNLSWREDGDRERLWFIKPAHPILKDVEGRYLELEHEETYAEPFDIPNPDEVVMIASYEGSEVFRAGCCFKRGSGNIFYFQPGHETYPTFHNETVQTIIKNAVRWAAPVKRIPLKCPRVKKIED